MKNRVISQRGKFEPFIGTFFIFDFSGDGIRMFEFNYPSTPGIHPNLFS
jgi:hypothetical protein